MNAEASVTGPAEALHSSALPTYVFMPTTAFSLFKLTFPRLLFFSYLNTMRKELADCRSCLDIGCGGGSPVRHLKFEYSVGVEGHAPTLEGAQRLHTHNEFRFAGATELDKHFSENQFDCCIALDLIEHLPKKDGIKLIGDMERIASKKILIFTPNGFLPQQSRDGDLWEHLSGWTAEEMESLGFKVFGMHGHKSLRGGEHQHRLKPAALSGIISALTHFLYLRRHPKNAAAILCVKEKKSIPRKNSLS